MIDGKKRMKDWEMKDNARKEQEVEERKKHDGSLSSSVSSHLRNNLEPTTPAANEEDMKKSEEWKIKGNEAYHNKDYIAAIDFYTKAIRLRGDNETLWSNRSLCYLSMGKEYNQKALADAEVCRRLKPTWPRGCYRLACARLALGLYDDAAVAAFEVYKLDESNQELIDLLQKTVQLGKEDHQKKLLANHQQQQQ